MSDGFDARLIRQWATVGLGALAEHRAELNALNVFPVPDGDTGTNLYLTFLAAADAESQRSGAADDPADALSAMARGALLGARGNSGVMLAQTLAAFAAVARANPQLSLARLLQAGAAAARAAVTEPMEGTALTVLDAAAEVFAREPGAAASAARDALAKTPTMLESLARAGVVDAGGRGVVVLLDALNAVWHGLEVDSPPVGRVPDAPPSACAPDAEFELMFLTAGEISEAQRSALAQVGVSIAITSDGVQSQVHIHTDDPQSVLRSWPDAKSVRIEKLGVATIRRLIVQAAGAGTSQLLAEAGALVVLGEPGARASVRDFVIAGVRSAASELLLLPSDGDSFKVAELAAAELRDQGLEVGIVPTDSLVQSLVAVSLHEPATGLAESARQLLEAVAGVRTYSISVAQRTANTDLGTVEPGELLAFGNGDLRARSADIVDVVCEALLHELRVETITLLFGAGLSAADAADVEAALAQMFPGSEVQSVSGGQAGSLLLIGVE